MIYYVCNDRHGRLFSVTDEVMRRSRLQQLTQFTDGVCCLLLFVLLINTVVVTEMLVADWCHVDKQEILCTGHISSVVVVRHWTCDQ